MEQMSHDNFILHKTPFIEVDLKFNYLRYFAGRNVANDLYESFNLDSIKRKKNKTY